jgi:hypothetical protein
MTIVNRQNQFPLPAAVKIQSDNPREYAVGGNPPMLIAREQSFPCRAANGKTWVSPLARRGFGSSPHTAFPFVESASGLPAEFRCASPISIFGSQRTWHAYTVLQTPGHTRERHGWTEQYPSDGGTHVRCGWQATSVRCGLVQFGKYSR